MASLSVLTAPAFASGLNPLGLYLGAGVGESDVRSTIDLGPYDFDQHATGWKVFGGLRPISLLGAELEYADFGHPHATALEVPWNLYSNAQQRASALSGMVYLPIPVPFLDLYGRAGIARVQSSSNAYANCAAPYPCPDILPLPSFSLSRVATDLLYGAGAQIKLASVAVRIEYERISESSGNPDLLSVGLSFTF